MASEEMNKENEQQQKGNEISSGGGFRGMLFEQYHKDKENAEACPYVWGSYLIVYGGFGLWMSYRYIKLRNTEDRVRALQDKLRKLRQQRDPTTSENVTSSLNKLTK